MISNEALPRTTPESLGIPSERVLKLVRDMDSIGNEVHGFMMARNGQVFAETWLRPYSPSFPHTNHSFGKSYTCTAVGIACHEGLLSPDDLVTDVFREEIERFEIKPSPLFYKMRLRDLMSMTDGMAVMAPSDEYWTEKFLRQEIVFEPGTNFLYNTMSSCMLGLAVEKVTGKRLCDYMREKLFDKIGIGEEDFVWLPFADGTSAEPGTAATTEANLRLALFYLNEGKAGGEVIVDPDWIREAVSVHSYPDPDRNTIGYGWQCWIGRTPEMFRFDGGQGQIAIADRSKNAVLAFHQGAHDPVMMGQALAYAEEFLAELGSDTPLPENPEALQELQAYLAGRRIPDGESRPVPEEAKKHEGTYYLHEGDVNFWIELCPYDEELYHQFWDYSVCWPVRTLAFGFHEDHIMMTVNGKSSYKLRLDGKQEVWETEGSVTPKLNKSCSTAYFEDEDTLVITVRTLNGWLVSVTRVTFTGQDIELRMVKDMLHENLPPAYR